MTKGLDDILKNLIALQVKAPKIARAAVSEVAEEFAEELKRNTPRGDTGEFLEHLEDDVVVSGFKGANQGVISKDIGFGRATGWRAHFPDEGTIYQASQEFEEKTIMAMTPKAKEIYAKKVREGLNL